MYFAAFLRLFLKLKTLNVSVFLFYYTYSSIFLDLFVWHFSIKDRLTLAYLSLQRQTSCIIFYSSSSYSCAKKKKWTKIPYTYSSSSPFFDNIIYIYIYTFKHLLSLFERFKRTMTQNNSTSFYFNLYNRISNKYSSNLLEFYTNFEIRISFQKLLSIAIFLFLSFLFLFNTHTNICSCASVNTSKYSRCTMVSRFYNVVITIYHDFISFVFFFFCFFENKNNKLSSLSLSQQLLYILFALKNLI